MTEQEKTIYGLEESVAFFRDKLHGDMFDKWLRASVDALALLKAQEPRVMMLDEVRDLAGNHEIVWAENNGCEHCCEGYCSPDLYYRTKEVILWEPGIEDEYEPNNALYGKTWRCWTSRPTDEQREATPWN